MTWALLPVRSLQGGKQRLSPSLTEQQREVLCRALVQDALAALQACPALQGILVVSRDPQVLSLAREAGVSVLQESGTGLNAAVSEGAQWVRQHGGRGVLVMHADLPLVTVEALSALLRQHEAWQGEARRITLVPDRHSQGSNVLIATPADAMPFAFGEHSLDAHLMLAARHGLACRVSPSVVLGCDLDTPDDLAYLHGLLQAGASGQCAIHLLREWDEA